MTRPLDEAQLAEIERNLDAQVTLPYWHGTMKVLIAAVRASRAAPQGFEEGRKAGIEEAVRVLGRIVFTEVHGLAGLKLTGPDRDEWIVMTTARKVIAQATEEIRARALAASAVPAPTNTTETK